MNDSPGTSPQSFDAIIIGAGPAGCEAALAAARNGADTLCLTINLDNVGFPPANPVIAEGAGDPRRELLAEIEDLGGALPGILSRDEISRELDGGILIADRRNLGLAYKELVEDTTGVYLRQTLVTGIQRVEDTWRVTTRLGESFQAAAVVVAAGTFLDGEINDGGHMSDGGRLGEIPAKALARSLAALGIELVPIKAFNMPRLDGKSLVGETMPSCEDYILLPDGSQLGEIYPLGPYISGTHTEQLTRLRQISAADSAWMTRAAWGVTSLGLAAGQVDAGLEALAHPRLLFAGRVAACCNYTEAAATGVIAGSGAAAGSGKNGGSELLIKDKKFVMKLCGAVADRAERPVTIRIDGPGC